MASLFERGEGTGRNSKRHPDLIWKSDIKEINCIAVYIADTSPQLLSHHGDSVCALPAEIHAPRTPMPLCPHRLTGRSLSQPGRAPFKQHVAHLDSRKQYQMLGRDFLQCAATGGGEGRQYVFQRNEIQKWTLRAGVVSNTANTGHSGQPGDWGDGITRDQAHSPRRGPHDICQTQEDISYVLQVLLHLWWIWDKKCTSKIPISWHPVQKWHQFLTVLVTKAFI